MVLNTLRIKSLYSPIKLSLHDQVRQRDLQVGTGTKELLRLIPLFPGFYVIKIAI